MTGSEKLTRLLRKAAAMNVAELAKQYSITADVVIENDDPECRRHALNVAKAINAIGAARFPNTWEAVREQECTVEA